MNQSRLSACKNIFRCKLFFAAIVALATTAATAQDTVLQLDPAHTRVTFILGDVLHTVRGTFQLKQGVRHFDPVTGKVSGAIAVDAKSGDSGSGMRDRKMHREILESERYPEIIFRPDSVQGTVAPEGKSAVRFAEFSAFMEPIRRSRFPPRWKLGRTIGLRLFISRSRM